MHRQWPVAFTFLALVGSASAGVPPPGPRTGPLTVVALGDAGDNTSALRACGMYLTNMHVGQHDAGTFDALIFLGDNFYPTGLNIPVDDVAKKVASTLEPFKVPMEELGRSRVHAIAGNHDYYARYAIEKSVLFGLVKIEEAPVGLSDRGNHRAASIGSWAYHFGMPGDAVYPIASGSADSTQFIFFDSAILLRTPAELWKPSLDSLRLLLAASRSRPGIVWRVFCAHHPFMSVGEHAGYTLWDDEANVVEYLTPCDKDSNALAWLKNSFDPEDQCTERYTAYVDSLRAAIRSAGAKIHLALAAHDHSLQLLAIGSGVPDDPFPSVQIVSGAASEPSRVRFPLPPTVYTSAQTRPSAEGISLPGFLQLRFGKERVRAVFYNADNGDPIDMGAGKTEFWLDRNGAITNN
ncbi:MAG: metallophosphoesterase [Bacteroidota bacterium]